MTGIFSGMEERTRLMEEMMARTGADEAVLGRLDRVEQYRAITLRCLGCTHGPECALWLDASERHSAAPAFCRNREAFATLTSG